jgi:hypothetical protein
MYLTFQFCVNAIIITIIALFLYCLYECVFFVSTRARFLIDLWAAKSARNKLN